MNKLLMDKNGSIKIDDLKNFVDDIIKDQEEKYKINLNLSLVTIGQYYKSDIFKKNLKLAKTKDKIDLIATPLVSLGFFSTKEDGNIFVFLSSLNKEKFKSGNLPNLVHTILHEIRHCHQSKSKNLYSDYEYFLFFMENVINDNNPNNYNLNYSKYYSEIDANYYAIRECEKYLNTDNSQYIDYYKKRYEYQLKTFDSEHFFIEFDKTIKNDKYFRIAINKYPFLKIFYNGDNSFKSFSEISKVLKTNQLDYNIVSTIICSKCFLNQLDLDNLNSEELNQLTEILILKIEEIAEKKKVNNDYFQESYIDAKEILFKSKNFSSKIDYLKLIINDYFKEDIINHLDYYKYDKKNFHLLNTLDKISYKRK